MTSLIKAEVLSDSFGAQNDQVWREVSTMDLGK